jgi:hypothetical protein
MRLPKPWALPTEPATRSVLLAGGVSVGMITTQLRAGRLVRLRQGVYLAATAWPEDAESRHLMLMRAELAANPEAVASHQSAALAWGLPYPGIGSWTDRPVAVTVGSGAGRRTRHTAAAHHALPLAPRHVTTLHGYPVTTPARTAIDLCGEWDLPGRLVLLDAAARLLCASFVASPRRSDFANRRLADAAREVLAEAAGRHLKELAPALDLAEPGRESPAESLSAGHFHLAGLPRPLFQHPVATPLGTLFPDCLWPDQRLIGECDGAVKYAQADAYVQEKRREQVLRDLGFGMVRWLGREIMLQPQVVVDRVSRALRA